MFNDHSWGFDWAEFLTGVLFIIAGIFIFREPVISTGVIVVLIGIAAIFSGIATLGAYSKFRRDTGFRANFALVFGIIDLLLGIYLLISVPSAKGAAFVGIVFAILFIIDSLTELMVSGTLRFFGAGYYWFSIVLDVFSLILGIVLLFNPVIAALSLTWIVGFYALLFGINAIVIAFARRG